MKHQLNIEITRIEMGSPNSNPTHSNMRRNITSTYEARIREMARDMVQVLRTSLHFNTWTAAGNVFAHSYMTRHRPIAADELYDTAQVGKRDAIRIQNGHAADNIYFRAPLRAAEDRSDRRPKRRRINPDQNWQPISLTHEDTPSQGPRALTNHAMNEQ